MRFIIEGLEFIFDFETEDVCDERALFKYALDRASRILNLCNNIEDELKFMSDALDLCAEKVSITNEKYAYIEEGEYEVDQDYKKHLTMKIKIQDIS